MASAKKAAGSAAAAATPAPTGGDAKAAAPQSDAAKALSAIAAAFSKDINAKPSAAANPANQRMAQVLAQAAGGAAGGVMSLAEQQRAVAAALEALGGSATGTVSREDVAGGGDGDDADGGGAGGGGAANLGKVAKKTKAYTPDPRNDPTKLVSVPCFIARPSEFKLLRDTMTDRNVYAHTYSDYLDENYEFCHQMATKQHHQVLRGTWDVRHYLAWCEAGNLKPRAASRKAYFHELAELAVGGKIDEPKPSFEQYIDDTQEGGVLRYCCRLGDDTPTPAPPVGPAASAAAAPVVAATAAAEGKVAEGKAEGKAKGKKKADKEKEKACGKLESKPKTFALCSVCKCACYCSPECQKKDWKNHKKWCAKIE